MFLEEEIQDKKPQIPTIQVSGTAVSQLPPKSGVMQVIIEEKASTQEAAWVKFQATADRFRNNVGSHGKIKNIMPRESSEEVSRTLRSAMEYTVKAVVDIEFDPSAYGDILKALISSELAPTTPRFVYDKTPAVTPDLYTQATIAAKTNAAAIAIGAGGRLGRLVSINVGPPRLKSIFRTHSDFLITNTFSRNLAANFNFVDLDEDELETFDSEVQVTVEYEIIENTLQLEEL